LDDLFEFEGIFLIGLMYWLIPERIQTFKILIAVVNGAKVDFVNDGFFIPELF